MSEDQPPSSRYLVPGRNADLEMQMLGTIVSSVAYGVVLMLSYGCFSVFSVDELRSPSKKMRKFLYIFVAALLLLSTLSFIHGSLIITMAIFLAIEVPSLHDGATYALPFTIWATDSFMIWRCYVLYHGISNRLRVMLFSFIIALYLLSLGSGIALLMDVPKRLPSVLIVALSTGLNVVITLLIILRLSYHQHYLKSVLGHGYSSPYKRVIVMTVESAAMNLFVCIPYLVLVGLHSIGRSAFILTLPHAPITSTLLIIYRVAQGRSAPKNVEEDSIPDLLETFQSSSPSGICFNKPPSHSTGSTTETV